MPTAEDEKFAAAVVKQGLVSEDAVQQCLAQLKRAEAEGAPTSLAAMLIRKGLLSKHQGDIVARSLESKRVLKKIGGFELLEEIGRGGMGTVYKARQVSMDRLVALKVLSPKLAKDASYIERFIREARAVARLSYANIIQGYDVGEASGCYYFAMEYVDGESLAERLGREGRIGEAKALRIVEQVAGALSHAQAAANIIHRDIKPDNIMLTNDGIAKLADLGLAKTPDEPGGFAAATPHYMSPEQASRSPNIDVRSDIYSLGATLFHMVTGVPPFTGTTVGEIMSKHVNAQPPSPRSLNPALSVGACRLIDVMMAKSREERYQTPDELIQDIRLVRDGLPPQRARKLGPIAGDGRSAARPPEPSSQAATIAVVSVIAVLVALSAVLLPKLGSEASHQQTAAGNSLEAEAAKVYAQAQEFEAANPRAFHDRMLKYETIAANYAQTSYGPKADARVQELRSELEREAAATFAGLKAEADELARKEHYAKAIEVLRGYPENLPSGRWTRAVSNEMRKHESTLTARVREIKEAAEKLAKAKHYEQAIATLQQGLEFGDETVTRFVQEQAARYRKLHRERQQQRQQDEVARARRDFERLLTSVLRLEQARTFAGAAQECERYLEQHGGNYRGQVLELKAEAEAAEGIWRDALAALERSVGRAIEIRTKGILLNGKLRKVSDTTFTVETRITSITKKVVEIDPDNILSLAGVIGEGESVTLLRARFFLATGAHAKAEEAVKKLGDEKLLAEWRSKIRTREKVLDEQS